MSILSTELLNPVTFKVSDPFSSIVNTMEAWLTSNYPDYLVDKWPQVKKELLKRILKLSKNGSLLRGLGTVTPSDELGETILSVYNMIDHCVYFTSKYWRAFYYYLKYNKLSECWTEFGMDEVKTAYSTLSIEELSLLKERANNEWVDFFHDKEELTHLFKLIKKPIQNLCYTRAKCLTQYDPSLYSVEDLIQISYEEALIRLRTNDYIPKDETKLVGWILKCVDNAILNLKSKMLANKRSFVIVSDVEETTQTWTPRLTNFYNEDIREFEFLNACQLIYNNEGEIDTNLNMKEILAKADTRVTTYFKTICYGEHNPEFWTWFHFNEPILAQRTSYIEENPDAIGPYLQRHLNLPTHELVRFLKTYLPSFINKTKHNVSAQKILKYVG